MPSPVSTCGRHTQCGSTQHGEGMQRSRVQHTLCATAGAQHGDAQRAWKWRVVSRSTMGAKRGGSTLVTSAWQHVAPSHMPRAHERSMATHSASKCQHAEKCYMAMHSAVKHAACTKRLQGDAQRVRHAAPYTKLNATSQRRRAQSKHRKAAWRFQTHSTHRTATWRRTSLSNTHTKRLHGNAQHCQTRRMH